VDEVPEVEWPPPLIARSRLFWLANLIYDQKRDQFGVPAGGGHEATHRFGDVLRSLGLDDVLGWFLRVLTPAVQGIIIG
jgi:hypothetical protein